MKRGENDHKTHYIEKSILFKRVFIEAIISLILLRMKPLFQKNRHEQPQNKKIKKLRYSVDTPQSSRPKISLGQKKNIRREIYYFAEKQKKQNDVSSKPKLKATMTVKISPTATKANSPFKNFSKSRNQNNLMETSAKSFKFFYQIGLGAFGKVWKVQQKVSGKEFALKELQKSKVIEKNNLATVISERKILSELNNPFLVNLHRSFQDENKLYLVIDYLRGADLRYHICYKQHFSQEQIRFITACMLLALEYIHSKKIIHKDIKPQNMIFQENGYLRLTDFGIAVRRIALEGIQSSGTPVYMAPEILFKRSYSYQSDFYSLGVVIFELAMGRRPYNGKTRSQIREQLNNKEICLSDFQTPKGYSPHLTDLLNRLLKKNPKQRLGKNSVKEIKDHQFFHSVKWKKIERKEVKPPYVPNVVSQTQGYLSEISLFNEMNQTSVVYQQNQAKYDFIEDYDFIRENSKKIEMKKRRSDSKSKIL